MTELSTNDDEMVIIMVMIVILMIMMKKLPEITNIMNFPLYGCIS